jgi:hypothetical protein
MRIILFVLILSNSFVFAEVKLEKITGEVREQYLERAQVWHPTEVSKMDIMAGPSTEISAAPDSEVDCEYIEPKDGGSTGAVPKFKCKTSDGQTVRVKFGSAEIYGEVIAARLLWVLGFYADDVYPVKLLCTKCPEKNLDHPAKEEKRIYRLIPYATIERSFPGAIIEESEDQGVKWVDADKISEEKGGAPRAQLEALELLAVFMQHSDSKPDNQRLACLNEDITDPDGDGIGSCSRPIFMIQDPGSTFGGGIDVMHVSRVNFSDWNDRPLWNVPKEAKFGAENAMHACFGNLTASMKAKEEGLNDPAISEEGRQFLAKLLNQLTDQQILDLFRVARVDQVEEFIENDGVKRRVTVDDWAGAFKKKRTELNEHECPSMTKEKD